MSLHRTALVAVIAGLAVLAGCGTARTPEQTAAQSNCANCHGGVDNQSGAPPTDVQGNTGTNVRSVGHHTAHVVAGYDCTMCHPARPSFGIPGHPNANVEIEFSGLALAGGTAQYDRQSGTCAVYCHGATLNLGGLTTTPIWTQPLGDPQCSQCHAFPPPAPHPPSALCSSCHSASVTANFEFVPGGNHLNGVRDVGAPHDPGYANPAVHGPDAIRYLSQQSNALECGQCHGADFNGSGGAPSCNACHSAAGFATPPWPSNCTFCHGTRNPTFAFPANLAQSAPPPDVAGSPTGPRVGAHQKHLTNGTVSNAFACATCHAVPDPATTPLAHIDNVPTVVLQGAGQLALPASLGTFAPANQTCAVYCHQQPGGTTPTPTWTGAALACNACHGLPPPTGAHPGNATPAGQNHAFMGNDCSVCHQGVVGTTLNVLDRDRHVNGAKDVALVVTGTYVPATATCNNVACHGTARPVAPWCPGGELPPCNPPAALGPTTTP
jgi:predicted CxxxxCH...CXXCH cytochrome family protein